MPLVILVLSTWYLILGSLSRSMCSAPSATARMAAYTSPAVMDSTFDQLPEAISHAAALVADELPLATCCGASACPCHHHHVYAFGGAAVVGIPAMQRAVEQGRAGCTPIERTHTANS